MAGADGQNCGVGINVDVSASRLACLSDDLKAITVRNERLEQGNEQLKKENEALKARLQYPELLCVGGHLHGQYRQDTGNVMKVQCNYIDAVEVYVIEHVDRHKIYKFSRIESPYFPSMPYHMGGF